MSTFEFWLGIHVNRQPACTIFGRLEMPVRPSVGERLSFHQTKGSALEFQVEWPEVGWSRQNLVSVEIEEVSHYVARTKQGVQVTSVLRTVPLNVRAVEDARAVRDVLTKQLGFEVDPYGINTLEGGE
jgi:hypothetical protein